MPPKDDRTPEVKAAENVQLTADAHQQAAEQRARDIAAGKGNPVMEVASAIRGKLEREEFQKHPQAPAPEPEA